MVLFGRHFCRKVPKVIQPDDIIPQTILSMKRLLETETEGLILFTAGGRIVSDGHWAIKTCIDYLEGVSEQILRLHNHGLSYEQIVDAVWGDENIFEELTGGDYSSKNMVRSIIENQPSLRI